MRRAPSDEFIRETNERLWADAVVRCGDEHAVPREERQSISDRVRALYAVQTWGDGSLARHLDALMIPDAIVDDLVVEYGDGEVVERDDDGRAVVTRSTRSKRGQKSRTIVDWLMARRGETFRVAEASAACEVSRKAVRLVIAAHPHLVVAGESRGEFRVTRGDD